MPKTLWTWILMGTAVVLIGGYGLLKIMSREPVIPMPVPQQGLPTPSASAEAANGGNPLLTADKMAVARWFPGYCFAELYTKDPSFGGKMIPGCVVDVIQRVKAETGITLTEEDIKSPDVLAHFKHVYGDDNQWRQ
ncbi:MULTISPECIES: hypothetical protein [Xanthomonas]|uniref:Uncharacterized protein n=1 Tax=Xanthomonas citri TaxID=346 RepID=Q7X0Z3_XANCI|nr:MULTISPECIES: hypothetical protein [Xanthomonas]AAO72135.1 hypothetical protein [Xanthomonas citri]AMV09395.1 hypothetical protein AC028_21505 [Xanthomonas citri pv. aurantifolii]ARE58993.1 hypothetical protein TP45_21855 [Xanthomonas citri pv. aurantifolii]EFF42084.1 conserved hypothetical protein [Xanthomonas citri pv. aurantifolii str. ICPB 11122]MBV6816266.1 hypothetical protein [Xanthomonas campestris pv. passiflorae]